MEGIKAVELKYKITVDDTELENALKKAQELQNILRECNAIQGELVNGEI